MFSPLGSKSAVVAVAAGLVLVGLTAWASGVPAQPVLRDTVPCDRSPPASTVVAPADFHLVVQGFTKLEIDASGKAVTYVQKSRGRHMGGVYVVDQRKRLSKAALDRIHRRVVACHFFELRPSYANNRVMDGWGMSIEVTAGGRTARVATYMFQLTRIDDIVRAANDEVRSAPLERGP